MKSLLVDVLRQAKEGGPEQTLSDSGSFDTTQSEFPATANDAIIDDADAADEVLKLYETSASMDATFSDDDEAQFDDSGELALAETADTSPDKTPRPRTVSPMPATHQGGPVLARFSPVACIVLAVVAAASWAGYQQLKLKYAESQFAMAQMAAGGAQSQETDNAGNPARVDRFPFISAEAIAADAEQGE